MTDILPGGDKATPESTQAEATSPATAEREAGQVKPGAVQAGPWDGRPLVDWKAFRFETGGFLLHVPTSHVLDAPAELVDYVLGRSVDPDAAAALAEIAGSLPQPAARQPIKQEITAVSLNMAQGCNLRCTYCFAGEGDYGNKAMMTTTTAIAALSQLALQQPRFHIIFFGGEPLLNFKTVQEVVAWCEAQPDTKFTYAITTNGTLLSDKKIEWLKSHRFSMNLSYDGKGLQAKQRLNKDLQSNSEALVEKKIAAFSEQFANLRNFILRATVTRGNLDLLEESIIDTLTSKNFKLVVSHHATPMRAFSFSEQDIEKLGAIMRRVVDRFLAADDIDRLLRLDNLKSMIRTIHHGRVRGMACGAGVNYLTVSAAGHYYLCHRFNEDETENYGSTEAGVDWDRLRAVADFRLAKTAPCKSCWMRQWCAGGCFHEHKSATGNKFAVDPLYCRLQAMEIEQALRVYTHLLDKDPDRLASL